MNRKGKSGANRALGTLAIVSALLVIIMLAFPIIFGTYYEYYGEYGENVYSEYLVCLGFVSLAFYVPVCERTLDIWYIPYGIINWFFVVLGAVLFILALISFLRFREKHFRKVCVAVSVTSAVAALVYMAEGLVIRFWRGMGFTLSYIPLILQILLLIAIIVIRIKYPVGKEEKKLRNGEDGRQGEESLEADTEEFLPGYYPLVEHTLLSVFLFFVWHFVWIYRITKYLNSVEGFEKRSPKNKVLLCIFVPFYTVYWYYQSTRRVDALAKKNGWDSGLTCLCTLMSLVSGVLSSVIVQDKINEVVKRGTAVLPEIAY